MKKNAVEILVVVLAVFSLTAATGCSFKRRTVKPTYTCNDKAEYWLTDKKGRAHTEIRVCFGSDGSLAWNGRPAPPPAKIAKKKAKRKAKK